MKKIFTFLFDDPITSYLMFCTIWSFIVGPKHAIGLLIMIVCLKIASSLIKALDRYKPAEILIKKADISNIVSSDFQISDAVMHIQNSKIDPQVTNQK